MDQEIEADRTAKRRRLRSPRHAGNLENGLGSQSSMKLPDELLLRILESIVPSFPSLLSASRLATRDFSSVCLVNRRFNRIATPFLYERIEREFPCDGDDEGCVLVRLLRTMQSRPDLRSCIKVLGRSRPVEECFYGCSAYGRAVMEKSAGELELPDQSFQYGCDLMNEDYLLALCAFLTPNLEHLETRLPKHSWHPGTGSLLLEHISRSAMGMSVSKVHSFNKLRSLHVEPGRAYTIPNKHAFPLTLLPNLEHLTLGAWGAVDDPGELENRIDPNDTEVFGRPWTWPVRSSPIAELCFLDPRTSCEVACQMILACRALKIFQCRAIYKFARPGNHFWYTHIASALHEHRHTLQELVIREDYIGIRECYIGRIRSLAHMDVLTYLRIPWSLMCSRGEGTLCGALPQGIKNLELELADFSNDDLLSSLLELCDKTDTSYPALKHVHVLWRQWNFDNSCVPDMMDTKHLFEYSTVQLDVSIVFSDSCAPSQDKMDSYASFFTASLRYPQNDIYRRGSAYVVKASTCISDPKEFENVMHGYFREPW